MAILIKRGWGVKVTREYKDKQGRILILNVLYNGMNLSLVNIYVPNDDSPQFFQQVFDILSEVENSTLVMGGDFNFMMDINKDKLGGKKVTHTKSVNLYKKKQPGYNLVDIW